MEILLYRAETFKQVQNRQSVFDGYDKKYWFDIVGGGRYQINHRLMVDILNVEPVKHAECYESWPHKPTNEYRAGTRAMFTTTAVEKAIHLVHQQVVS